MQTGFSQNINALRQHFQGGATRTEQWRQAQLASLTALIDDNEALLHEALRSDVGKPGFEAWLTETQNIRNEIRYVRRHLRKWLSPRRVHTPLQFKPGTSTICREPLGVVLIIGPWNYPFQLIAAPLIGALAGGNCAVLKPSEYAPATAAVFAELLPRYVDSRSISVVQGGASVTSRLVEERFDHIFYTGSCRVGQLVMRSAARHPTPVTLELGGKSPCLITPSANLDSAVRRIAWGKYLNAGQTCVAPDYLLVPETLDAAMLRRLTAALAAFYGSNPKASKDYGRIVNRKHFDRLLALLQHGRIAAGGDVDAQALYIAPTVLTNVDLDSPLMQDEIFGPLLPVIPYQTLDDAVEIINGRATPLALYVFSENRRECSELLERIPSGGVCINDTIVQLANPALPFGGRGGSGIGHYHGRYSFETFTHARPVLARSSRVDPALRYPPYTSKKQKWLRRLT